MAESEEDALVKDAQRGDRDAFSRLLALHYSRIYRLSYRLCGRREDAEDVTQEVCIKLARSIGQFRGEAGFSTWLYTIITNTARDYLDKRKRREGQEEGGLDLSLFAAHGNDPEQSLFSRLVHRCIAVLPDALRMALLLVHGEGLTHRQAGETLNCAEGTISWRLSEARKALSICLEKGG